MITTFLKDFWQINIEFSLLLLAILVARYVVRKTIRNYNAYLIWLSIPLALIGAVVMSFIRFTEPPVVAASEMVHSYLIEPVQSIDYWAYIGYGWLALALIFLARLLVQHAKLRRDLHSITLDAAHGLESSYPIVLIDKLGFSPAVYGFWKPKIYFPIKLMDELSSEQVSLIIKHEEHHIKQQHLWLNLVWDIAVCCFWFNPLVYIARKGFRHDQELFCDYLVLNKSNNGDQESYGLALLSTVSATHSVSLLCSWKAFNQLEERIMNIKQPVSRLSKCLLLAFSTSIVGLTSLYAVGDDGVGHLKIGTHVLLGLDNKVYVVEDDVKRPATEAEIKHMGDWIEEVQNQPPISKSTYTPSEEEVKRMKLKENGSRTTSCIFYEEDMSQHDECKVIQGGSERVMTPEETAQQRAWQQPDTTKAEY